MVDSPKGFFSSLYDLSFDTFITPRIIRITYIVWLVGIALWALTFLFAGFAMQSTFMGEPRFDGFFVITHIVGALVIFVVGSISARISLEFVIAVFRIAENTASLRHRDTPGD